MPGSDQGVSKDIGFTTGLKRRRNVFEELLLVKLFGVCSKLGGVFGQLLSMCIRSRMWSHDFLFRVLSSE